MFNIFILKTGEKSSVLFLSKKYIRNEINIKNRNMKKRILYLQPKQITHNRGVFYIIKILETILLPYLKICRLKILATFTNQKEEILFRN